jgi:hypothetical protein
LAVSGQAVCPAAGSRELEGARALPRLGGFGDGLAHAALTPEGRFYCFDVADPRYPGRVVYMPME